jgi:hypothetical protein
MGRLRNKTSEIEFLQLIDDSLSLFRLPIEQKLTCQFVLDAILFKTWI